MAVAIFSLLMMVWAITSLAVDPGKLPTFLGKTFEAMPIEGSITMLCCSVLSLFFLSTIPCIEKSAAAQEERKKISDAPRSASKPQRDLRPMLDLHSTSRLYPLPEDVKEIQEKYGIGERVRRQVAQRALFDFFDEQTVRQALSSAFIEMDEKVEFFTRLTRIESPGVQEEEIEQACPHTVALKNLLLQPEGDLTQILNQAQNLLRQILPPIDQVAVHCSYERYIADEYLLMFRPLGVGDLLILFMFPWKRDGNVPPEVTAFEALPPDQQVAQFVALPEEIREKYYACEDLLQIILELPPEEYDDRKVFASIFRDILKGQP